MLKEKTRLVLWLVSWAVMVLGIVVPLALWALGILAWDVAAALPSGMLAIFAVVTAFGEGARPRRRPSRRSQSRQRAS